ncbi:MAG: metallophosphoesterase [Chitinophagaceae bacterium]|nr:metallophosphoesterase [Chitinophagaceae bacterium]
MRVQYCSDLHLEDAVNNRYMKENPLGIAGDILILAGDISPLHDIYLNNSFFTFISNNYEQVFWLPGNHEYYHKDLSDYPFSCSIKLNPKINIVNNISVVYKEVRFVFSTLWSKISADETGIYEATIPDFKEITFEKRKLRVDDINGLHEKVLHFYTQNFPKTGTNNCGYTSCAYVCRQLTKA